MLISASRRTDIPACYAEWFCNRIREGYVLVRHPVNARQIRRVSLRPDSVDGIVFWTKNPLPLLDRLSQLDGYVYYVQFTLNAYGQDLERGVPSKGKVIIPAFQRLADRIGPERVIWRYDPILFNATYTMAHHVRYFEVLATRLAGYTRTCTISFLDTYRHTAGRLDELGVQAGTSEQQCMLASQLADIARSYGLAIQSCVETMDLQAYGIQHARCIDDRLFEKLIGRPFQGSKDAHQRRACGCVESVDIGAYNTCRNGCRYCYATFSTQAVAANTGRHDPQSPLLVGEPGPDDTIIEQTSSACRMQQLKLVL